MRSQRLAMVVSATIACGGCLPWAGTDADDPGKAALTHIFQIHRLIERNERNCGNAAAAVKAYVADHRDSLVSTRSALSALQASMPDDARAEYVAKTNARAARNAKKTARRMAAFAAACPDAIREISESLAFMQPAPP